MANLERASVQTNLTKRTNFRWVILGIVFLVYAVNFADRTNISIVLPVLRSEFQLSNMEAGSLASIFFLGYGVSMLPAGLWMSRFGPRGLGAIAIVGFSLFTFLIGSATSAATILWSRFGLGVAEGPIPVGGAALARNWFPKHEQATAAGIWQAAGMVGMLIVPPLAVWILMNYGWHYVFYFFAAPGFVLAAIWYWIVRSHPKECSYCNDLEAEYIQDDGGQLSQSSSEPVEPNFLERLVDKFITRKQVVPVDSVAKVFTNKNILGITIAFACIGFVSWGVVAWVPSYLIDAKGYSFVKMGWVAASPWIGGLFGCIGGGLISDKLLRNRRKPNLMITPVAIIFLMYALINAPNDAFMLSIILFFIGVFIYTSWACYFAYPMLLATKKTYPVAISFLLTVGNIGGFFSPIIAGRLLDVFNKNYDVVFIFFAICAVVNLLVISMLDEPAPVEQ